MKKVFLLYLMIFLGVLSYVSATNNLLDCQFKSGVCSTNEVSLFYANSFMNDGSGNVLNAPVATTYSPNYNQSLCCRVNSPSISNIVTNIENFDKSDADMTCSNGGEDLMYFTDTTNAKVGFPTSPKFDKSFLSKKLCINLPDKLSGLDILVSDDENYGKIGYSCLYKTASIESNGVVSSCDSTFNAGDNYKYSVWGKLMENIESLKCNSDCTSKLDNRVYSSCGQKVSSCSNVPVSCDGSLLGGWVSDNSNTSRQIQCSSPWNNYRDNIFKGSKLKVSSIDEKCSNLIKRKYSVILDNELVTMSVYICQD